MNKKRRNDAGSTGLSKFSFGNMSPHIGHSILDKRGFRSLPPEPESLQSGRPRGSSETDPGRLERVRRRMKTKKLSL